ncbi:hypothetical protein [Nocardia sp. NPDC050793]|uniref:hypothetical protein n=1 Tax=Nocardia sp. NPDC050793 TaxID=3155159 RepID=UPI0033EDE08D
MSTAAAVSAFVQIITTPAVTSAQFETVNAGMGSEPIRGILLSAAGFVAGNLVTLDVWDSRAAADRFVADRLIPAFEHTGVIPEPDSAAVEFDGRMTVSAAPPHRAHIHITKIPGITVAEYDRVDSVVGAAPVTGQFVHLAGVSAGALYVIDLWDSHEAADRFLTERLYPAFERAGVIPDPDVTMVEFDAQVSPPVSSE